MQHFMSMYIHILSDTLSSTVKVMISKLAFCRSKGRYCYFLQIIMTRQGMQLALTASIASSQATVYDKWMLLHIRMQYLVNVHIQYTHSCMHMHTNKHKVTKLQNMYLSPLTFRYIRIYRCISTTTHCYCKTQSLTSGQLSDSIP